MRFEVNDAGEFYPSRTGEIVINAPSNIEDNWRGHFRRYRRLQKQLDERYYARRREESEALEHRETMKWARAVLAEENPPVSELVMAKRLLDMPITDEEKNAASEELRKFYKGMEERIYELWT